MQRITAYIQAHNNQYHYQTVLTPVLGPKKLYETSGHLKYYRANMFPMLDTGDEQFFLRPMTCPHHIKVYQLLGVHSYRALPLRIAETTQLYRYEFSGALGGLERCRIFTLPDAHIFVGKTMLADTITDLYREIMHLLADFHLTVDHITLATNDPSGTHQSFYYPDPALWTKTITILHETIKQVVGEQLPITVLEDDAAFYGPKIDINVKNNDGQTITLATLQVDFGLPRKFQLSYITAQQQKAIPFILHRGMIGSIERFIAILLEQTQG